MKRRLNHPSGRFLLLVFIALFTVQELVGAEKLTADGAAFYVAPNGDDKNAGTKEKPFATLSRARDAVRKLKKTKPKGDIPVAELTVLIRGGTYTLTETVVFELEDSGSECQVITYAAYPGEEPVFSSGEKITGWKKLEKEPDALPAAAKGKVWVADVPETKGGSSGRSLPEHEAHQCPVRDLMPGLRACRLLCSCPW